MESLLPKVSDSDYWPSQLQCQRIADPAQRRHPVSGLWSSVYLWSEQRPFLALSTAAPALRLGMSCRLRSWAQRKQKQRWWCTYLALHAARKCRIVPTRRGGKSCSVRCSKVRVTSTSKRSRRSRSSLSGSLSSYADHAWWTLMQIRKHPTHRCPMHLLRWPYHRFSVWFWPH